MKYFHTGSKYGNLVAIPDYSIQESFLRAARDKVWVDETLIHFSGGKKDNKMTMEQYLSKYLFEKYEYELMFASSQCGLPVRTSMN